MSRALKLAKKGIGRTSPNPPVGAIVVKDGRIIGEGFHAKAGTPHAEIVAINNAIQSGHSLENAEIYITLEPCCHHGKTPPCTDAIIANGFEKVFYAIDDPNPQVAGKSKTILEAAGIQVEKGILQNEAEWILAPFFKCMKHQRAFIAIKYASSLDGRIASGQGDSKWISSEKSRDFVHHLRDKYDAIAVGTNTLLFDDPQLTVRRVDGRNPTRIIISGRRKLSVEHKLFTDRQARTIVATSNKNPFNTDYLPDNIEVWHLEKCKNGQPSIKSLAKIAEQNGISSILIEGGSGIITSALDEAVVDRVYLVFAPIIIGEGISAIGNLGINQIRDSIKIEIRETRESDGDIIIIGTPKYES